MVGWKFRGRNFYFNYKQAMAMIAFLCGIPFIILWANNYTLKPTSLWNLCYLLFVVYIVCANCLGSYSSSLNDRDKESSS